MVARSLHVLVAICVFVTATLATAPARADEPELTSTQLAPNVQAVGWWLGGAGVASGLSGAFTLGLAAARDPHEARGLELGAGLGLSALGAAALIVGILLMSSGSPGPCDIHGTAHDGVAASADLPSLGPLALRF
jgi:hypothetical protein